jgi:hypothetical protein
MGTEIMTAQIPLTHAGTKSLPTYSTGYNTQTYGWLWNPGGALSTPTNGWRVDISAIANKQANLGELQFYCNDAAPTNRYALMEVYAVRKDGTLGTADEKTIYLGEFQLRSGSANASGGVLSTTTYRFIDKITTIVDASNSPPGVRVLGDVDNKAAAMQFDTSGVIALIILIKQGPTDPITTLGLFWTVL